MKMTKTKALAAGIVTTLTTFLTSLVVALGDDVVTQTEWLTIAIATLASAGAAFGVTYAAPANRPVYDGPVVAGRVASDDDVAREI